MNFENLLKEMKERQTASAKIVAKVACLAIVIVIVSPVHPSALFASMQKAGLRIS